METTDSADNREPEGSGSRWLALIPLVLFVVSMASALPTSPAAWATLGVLTVALIVGLYCVDEPEQDAS
jgi:hypothetical protein